MVKPKATMPWGNHFSFLHVPLPKLSSPSPGHDPSAKFDPLDFVYASHHIIKRKRNNAAALLTGGLLDHVRKIKGPEVRAYFQKLENIILGPKLYFPCIPSSTGWVTKMKGCLVDD